jgi:glycosyltransferase involved in cell wall biosynthesis
VKIAYLCFDDGISIGSSKGAAVHVFNITEALNKIGHEVMVITVKGEEERGVYNFDLRILELSSITRHIVNLLGRLPKVKNITRDSLMLVKLFDYRFTALRILKKFNPDMLIERYSLFCLNGVRLSKKLNTVIGLEINAPVALEARRWRSLGLPKLASQIESKAFRSADICFTVSKELNQYVSNLLGTSDSVETLPNGVDTLRFNTASSSESIRNLYNIPLDATVVGYVGGFKGWHDVPTLINAFQRIVRKNLNLYLFLVGSGDTYRFCEELAKSDAFDNRVIFTGNVPPESVPEYLAAIDIAVAPFIPMDFFYFSPLKLYEYMAAGKCIVTNRLGQIGEIITHQENGWLCEPGDIDGLAQALEVLMVSSEMRFHYGMSARKMAEEKHNWTTNAHMIVDRLGALVSTEQ